MIMGNTIVCGLTEWEKKEIKEHKGECKHCMHYLGYTVNTAWDNDWFVVHCDKKGNLPKLQTDCEDWVLDTR